MAKEMGWTIEHILNMSIMRYDTILRVISEHNREQGREAELASMKRKI